MHIVVKLSKILSQQVAAEFKRIVNMDLEAAFLIGLDEVVPRLLEVYEAGTKSGKKQLVKAILDCLKKDVSKQVEICAIYNQTRPWHF